MFIAILLSKLCYVIIAALGNLLVVPIIKLIGMTMALTVWGIFNMLSGWLQGMSVYPNCQIKFYMLLS